jgi:hypothetical protein
MNRRIRFYLSLAVVIVCGVGVGFRVNARPYKVDYHGAICQRIAGSVTYNTDGVKATSAGTTIVCPLVQITDQSDSVDSANTWFKLAFTGTLGSYSCTLKSIDASTGSTWSISLSGTASGDGVVTSQAFIETLPYDVSQNPMRLYIYCDTFATNMKLSTIQVTTNT